MLGFCARTRGSLLTASLLLLAGAVGAGAKANAANATTTSTLIYRTMGERRLQLAAHYPPGWSKEDKRPVVLLFSGGHKVVADASGNLPPLAAERAKRRLPVVNAGAKGPGAIHKPLADHFAQRGLVCFRVEYRTRGKDGVLPGADLEDAVDAMRWVRRNAATLGIDPGRVIAAGCSSGGYLAAGLFALEDLAPKDEGAPPVSARPDALLLFSPLLDWLEGGDMTDEFLVVLGGDKELGAKLSPIRHWRADMPPTLILEGTEEPPFATVKAFADKWTAQGAPLEIFIAEGGPHGFFGKPEWVEKANARADEFLQKLGYLNDAPRVEPPALPKKSEKGEKGEKSEKGARGEKGATDTADRLASMLQRAPEADANKDGVLTMEEAQAYKGKTKKPKGAKGDGKKKDEKGDVTAADKGAAPAAGAPSTTDSASLPKPSRDWDKDKDGKISKAEFKAPAALFDNLDFDHDGFLSGDELAKLDSKLDLGKTDDAVWVVPPDKDYPGVQHKTYHSAAMNTEVGYNIYLPDEYQTSGKRYPVIYHLHGSGGNESSQVNLSQVYHKAITEKRMRPVIIVFANGGKHSYYCDGANGKVMAETTIIKELIPHVDGAYRTIPETACRVIHGFSMGGFGAMKLGFKYPDLFCAVLSFGGGMAPPDSVHLDFLKHIVGDDRRIIAENNPADLALKNKDALRDTSIWLFTGTRDVAREDSTWAHEWLQSHGIAHRFEVSEDVGHAVNRHYDFFGDDIFKMLMKRFEGSKTVASKTADELAVKLRSEDLAARITVALALIEKGTGAKEAYPALIEALTQDEALDHAVALHAVYREPRPVGDTAALAAALGLSTKARVAAAWELSRIGPAAAPAVPALIGALADKDKHARNFAAVALAAIGPEAREAIPALEAVLKDEGDPSSPQMNYKYPHAGADFALSRIKPAAVRTGATSDGASLVRRLESEAAPGQPAFDSGLRALGGYAGTAKPVGKGKNRALPPVHESVTLALAYLASLDKPPSPEEIARQEKAGELAGSTRTYLMALGGLQQGLVPVLAESVQRSQSDARAQAVRDLDALGPAAREAAPLLQVALRDRDWIVRYEAYYALRRIDPSLVAPPAETGKRAKP